MFSTYLELEELIVLADSMMRRDRRLCRTTIDALSLYLDEAEAQVLALRADLMAQLEQTLKARKVTQVAASKVLGVSQGRVSDLARGKVEKFSLDMLVTFAAKLGKPAKIELGQGS